MDTDYPGWNATFMARDPHPSDGDRDDEEPLHNGTFNCRPDHEGWANRGAIRDGIQYPRKVPGTAKTELGPTTAAVLAARGIPPLYGATRMTLRRSLSGMTLPMLPVISPINPGLTSVST
ncbi:hypothetical protein QC762_0093120 [Podospora pseudocomata]|uniref:Uncharacterized protein n=1 Tax=Podospora pseudocomata TaxID=2093779 RepID=A0ABR0G754_9PEZI|nr:hypothetical protein QC762_0093120 [Podospora pseudocomata]